MDLSSFQYYQTIMYTGCDREVYQQDVVVHRSEGNAYEETVGGLNIWHVFVGNWCKDDYGDIRFSDDMGQELAYYLWPDYDAESARFCVRLEGADQSGALTVWYGNPTAATTSDGDATYEIFDHFDGETIDAFKWYTESGIWSISDGHLKQSLTGGDRGVIRSNTYSIDRSNLSHILETKVRWGGGSIVYGSHSIHLSGHTPMGDYVQLTLRYESSRQVTEIRTDGGVPSVKFLPWDRSSWHVLRMDCHGSTVDGYIDGVRQHTSTNASLTQSPLYVGSHVWDAQPQIDYILARAYSVNPPSAIVFSGECRATSMRRPSVSFGSSSMMIV